MKSDKPKFTGAQSTFQDLLEEPSDEQVKDLCGAVSRSLRAGWHQNAYVQKVIKEELQIDEPPLEIFEVQSLKEACERINWWQVNQLITKLSSFSNPPHRRDENGLSKAFENCGILKEKLLGTNPADPAEKPRYEERKQTLDWLVR